MKTSFRIFVLLMLAFALAAKPLAAAQNGKSSASSQKARTQSAPPKSSASYLSIPSLASTINMDVRKTSDGKRLHYTVSSKWCTLEFDEGKRICKVNGVQIQLSNEILQQRGALYISNSDYRKMIEPLILPQDFKPVPKLKIIMIDPGHGGNDAGAENKTLKIKEKLITLDLALKLKDELEDRGYTVFITRNKDKFVELDDRPAMANKVNADLFVCLHFNAASDSSVHGAETYILPPLGQASSTGNEGDGQVIAGNKFDAWNVIAGYYVQRELSRSVGTADRGLRRARFAVLRPLKCPGMLIESGYVSNPGECYKLSNATYRRKLADSIADAIDAYGKTLKRISDSQ